MASMKSENCAWVIGSSLIPDITATTLFRTSARESQPKLQQLIPGIAFDDPLDDAIDFGCVLERGEQCRARELLRCAAYERLSRAAPHARFAQYIGKRPARGDAVLHAADGADFLGEDPQHARRRFA